MGFVESPWVLSRFRRRFFQCGVWCSERGVAGTQQAWISWPSWNLRERDISRNVLLRSRCGGLFLYLTTAGIGTEEREYMGKCMGIRVFGDVLL